MNVIKELYDATELQRTNTPAAEQARDDMEAFVKKHIAGDSNDVNRLDDLIGAIAYEHNLEGFIDGFRLAMRLQFEYGVELPRPITPMLDKVMKEDIVA